MAYHQIGKADEAQNWLKRAKAELDARRSELPWQERIELELLRQEAESLILKKKN